MNKAVITGMGPVTVLGTGKSDFEEALFSQQMPEWQVTDQGVGGYLVSDADVEDAWSTLKQDYPNLKMPKHADRVTELSLLGSLLALQDAGLTEVLANCKVSSQQADRWAVTYGSALSGFSQAELGHEQYLEAKKSGGRYRAKPSVSLELLHVTPPAQIAMLLGITGQTTAHANSCAAGHTALIEAQRLIELGLADVVIAGSTECPMAPYTAAALTSLKVVSPKQIMQPCTQGRDGFVFAEGAAFFIVESEAHAQGRGANIYAEIAGNAIGNEAAHMTQPRDAGISVAEVMMKALDAADIWGVQVDVCVLHASATPQNDKNEALAMSRVFESAQKQPLTVALKARFGHSLGSASAIQVVAILLMMQRNESPYLGLEQPVDESLNLIIHPKGAKQPINTVLSNAFGFGGINTSIVFTSR